MTEHDERFPKPVGAFQQQVAPGVRITYEADRIVDRASNGGRETLLIDNAHFGRLMFVDGALRSSSADEFIYHEMMSHVPILGHGEVKHPSAAFPHVTAYLVPAPEVLASRFANAFIGAHYYTPEVHRAAFALPKYLRNTITAATRPDEEETVVRSFLRMS